MTESPTTDARNSGKRSVATLYDLGFERDYAIVWNLQKKLVDQKMAGMIPDSVIFVEHDNVLTLGRSSHIENILVKDLPIFEIERGGDVTYHGPGQLVVYPIISLQERGLSVRQYVELLEATIIDALRVFGLEAEGQLGKMTGVWINSSRKVASIGIATSHWVTYHGFALNVNTDLSYFEKINPCGFDSSIMTSISKETGKPSDFEKVKLTTMDLLARKLGVEFSRESPQSK